MSRNANGPSIQVSSNIKQGIRVADALSGAGYAVSYFGPVAIPRPILARLRAMPMPGLVSQFNETRVQPELSRVEPKLYLSPDVLRWASARLAGLPEHHTLALTRGLFDRRVAREIQPSDVFHFMSGAGLHSAQRARSLGARVVCQRRALHHLTEVANLKKSEYPSRYPESSQFERLDKEYGLADVILCNSELTASSFRSQGYPSNKLAVIHNGVDLEIFPRKTEPRAAAKGTPRKFLYVGRYHASKGVETLLKALSRVEGEFSLTCIGAGPLRPEIAQAPLPKVTDLGKVPQNALATHYAAADCVILPSLSDAFGYVAAEAMACGTGVIVSDNCGVAEIVAPAAGDIFRAGDCESLASILQRYVDDPELPLQRWSALEEIRPYLGWRRFAHQVVELYGILTKTDKR